MYLRLKNILRINYSISYKRCKNDFIHQFSNQVKISSNITSKKPTSVIKTDEKSFLY